MIVSDRPSLSAVPRNASGTAERCSTTSVGLSWVVLFQAIQTPTADTISAARAIISQRLTQRRRRASGDSVIGRQLPTAAAAPQAPSFAEATRRPAPNRPRAD